MANSLGQNRTANFVVQHAFSFILTGPIEILNSIEGITTIITDIGANNLSLLTILFTSHTWKPILIHEGLHPCPHHFMRP